jgi:tRNA G18 (ribose-2'-O)-methylase SpoU
MPLLTNKNSILEVIKEHPGEVRKLWIEQGSERILDECIREAKAHGIQFRVLAKDAFFNKFKGVKSHICLERDEFSYTDPDYLLKTLTSRENPFFCAFDGVQDPQNLGNIIRSAACLGADALIIPKDRACAITDTVTQIEEPLNISRSPVLPTFHDTSMNSKRQAFSATALTKAGKSLSGQLT